MVDNLLIQSASMHHLVRRPHFDSDRMAGTVPVWDSSQNIEKSPPVVTDRGLVLPSRDISAEVAAGKTPSFSFGEFLDVVNPLHHIPVVGDLYREFTGDDISPVARVIGGGIYGGPLGFAASIANAAIEEHSGQTMVGNIMSKAFNSQARNGNIDIQADIKIGDKAMPPPSQRWHFNT